MKKATKNKNFNIQFVFNLFIGDFDEVINSSNLSLEVLVIKIKVGWSEGGCNKIK